MNFSQFSRGEGEIAGWDEFKRQSKKEFETFSETKKEEKSKMRQHTHYTHTHTHTRKQRTRESAFGKIQRS